MITLLVSLAFSVIEFTPLHGLTATYEISSAASINFYDTQDNKDYEGIVMLSNSTIGATVEVNGAVYEVKEETKLIRVRDFPARIAVSNKMWATAWLIPKGICDGPIVGHISDYPRFSMESSDTSYNKLCYFPMKHIGMVVGSISFSNSGGQSDLYYANDFRNGGRNPGFKCTGSSCTQSLTTDDNGIFVAYSTSKSAKYSFNGDFKLNEQWYMGNEFYVGVTYSSTGVESYSIANSTKYSTGSQGGDGGDDNTWIIIIGVIIGVVVLVGIISLIVFLVVRKKKNNQNNQTP